MTNTEQATTEDQFADDPFADGSSAADELEAAKEPLGYPKLKDLAGHLLILKAVKFEERIPVPDFDPSDPKYQDRVTTDVWVVDGPLDGFEDQRCFPEIFFSQRALVDALAEKAGTRRLTVGRPFLKYPRKTPGKSNPWILAVPTEEEMARAKAFWTAL